ncbi:hypothetical protein PYH37_001698 [Sinorhizobium numidicum]|uniref:Uncharacterized protein n=1 Tax=Sinorhizobium numidicum TaxID=680248 RepID=A0ABY8CS40_9HYPH|nr:hypothetical protein [Sinorhizobium numidicum]WEX74296.1 hypothetical protein PYH37_001698 [Sinorhizobium numidicum]WEX80282.1 hypothetical protein PYH38_001699 [Sinorhizobium numidicum]
MSTDAKRQLVDFLVKRAFDPVMKARPDGRSDADRRKLEHVQKATQSEIERFRGYDSAEEVVVNFKRDLDSRAAKKIHAELKELKLPTINDIRDEFEKEASALGVRA